MKTAQIRQFRRSEENRKSRTNGFTVSVAIALISELERSLDRLQMLVRLVATRTEGGRTQVELMLTRESVEICRVFEKLLLSDFEKRKRNKERKREREREQLTSRARTRCHS